MIDDWLDSMCSIRTWERKIKTLSCCLILYYIMMRLFICRTGPGYKVCCIWGATVACRLLYVCKVWEESARSRIPSLRQSSRVPWLWQKYVRSCWCGTDGTPSQLLMAGGCYLWGVNGYPLVRMNIAIKFSMPRESLSLIWLNHSHITPAVLCCCLS